MFILFVSVILPVLLTCGGCSTNYAREDIASPPNFCVETLSHREKRTKKMSGLFPNTWESNNTLLAEPRVK